MKSLVFDYIVNDMCPVRTCEKPNFKNLIVGLPRSNDTQHKTTIKIIGLQIRTIQIYVDRFDRKP